ncbi:MAG: sensor histidine kinase [Bdellovibrionota bacterium]
MEASHVSEQPLNLFELLISQREDLIRSWMKRVRDDDRIPSAENLTSVLLRDHFPQLLNQIVLALAKHKSGLLDTDGAVTGVSRSEAAQAHVTMRFLSGYTLLETLRELGHLRSEIVSRGARSQVRPSEDELDILHSSFDEVMAMAADEINARTSNAKDVFHARLSHELGTPATAIVGCVDVIRNEPKDSEKFLKSLDVLSRNAELLVATVENLRDLSQLIFGRLRISLRSSDANEIAKLAAETIYHQGVEKKVEISLRLEPEGRKIVADPVKLHQALLNILNNAVKFTPEGGSIELRCQSDSDQVEFIVIDTGEGIAEEFLPFVFEQFRQESTSDRTRGLGIGLAIAREIVEGHGGQISVASPGKGLGSTFAIKIPVRTATH